MAKIQPIVQVWNIAVPTRVARYAEDGPVEERDGEPIDAQIEIVIDLDYIVQKMGRRAVRNRSGRTNSGPVRVVWKKMRLKGGPNQ